MKAYRPLLIATAASAYILVRYPGAWLAVTGIILFMLAAVIALQEVIE